MTFATRLVANTEPWNVGIKESGKTDYERWLNAIAKMFEPVLELCEEEKQDGEAGFVPAWGKLLNAELCPNSGLAYLGQFVGVQVRKGATEAEARAEVKAESGMERGTRKSLEMLLKKALGEKPFTILERTQSVEGDNAYFLQIIIPKGSIPTTTYEEVNLTIPAGIWYSVIERSDTWFSVAKGKKWSEVKAGLKWSEAVEGEP